VPKKNFYNAFEFVLLLKAKNPSVNEVIISTGRNENEKMHIKVSFKNDIIPDFNFPINKYGIIKRSLFDKKLAAHCAVDTAIWNCSATQKFT
jgi:hypothetical protein